MEKDFYLGQRGLASYFEREWFDHVTKEFSRSESRFEFPPFTPSLLYCDYHEKFADFLSQCLRAIHHRPTQLLEIGSSMGRTFYETIKRTDSLKNATLVEPSQNLANAFSKIFSATGPEKFSLIKGIQFFEEIEFDGKDIRAACAGVKHQLVNLPYEQLSTELEPSELVICSNVIDQCKAPLEFIHFLKQKTLMGGVLALSCTYQWQERYTGLETSPIQNISDLFQKDEWEHLGETDLEYRCRVSERHWNTFLPRVSVFKRLS